MNMSDEQMKRIKSVQLKKSSTIGPVNVSSKKKTATTTTITSGTQILSIQTIFEWSTFIYVSLNFFD